ncbi:glucose-1-phosphate thymidylyltransferase RfbA [Dongia sedimenti]|uniref:Glucose-1-phosphate thymidylyltransferase n=1 Tax=Dongia sedimenti TaxID=3064282 RepID=A0ABU0YGT7_9PROT|nr:glucose-1-phosphate thymidylyltransferase RfbA [Rhodospirillaceae bacterium R-7]
MKGIILAGGAGSRLRPVTTSVNKHLLAVYDKPLVYYPLATVMLSGAREILLIVRPEDETAYRNLFGDGSALGLTIQYRCQERPRGVADALLIGRDFVAGEPVVLALGDNIFFGHGLRAILKGATSRREGATIFCYWVNDPERFGVAELDAGQQRVVGLAEKPKEPKSNYAVTGLYFYDAQAADLAASLEPSERGELEITDLNLAYLARGQLHCHILERGFAWLDTGTPDALLDAANYIATIERRQGLKIACIEEIAWRQDWIDGHQLRTLADRHGDTPYGRYLADLPRIGR